MPSADADLPFRLEVQGMGVLLPFGHGEVERLLGGDDLAVLVVKSPVLPVDVDVPASLHVLVALDGATLLLPMKLLGFMLR